MSHLEERITVACPLAQAAMRVASFVAAHTRKDMSKANLTLEVDLHVPGLPLPLTLERAVVATIEAHHLSSDMAPRYRVHWQTEKPGPFPVFAGELVVEGGDDYDSFALRLTGDYTPPLGIVGSGFDAAVGNRIARTTANDLLQRMKAVIERAFTGDEARKRQTV